jgi:hypothetical protein
MVVYAVATDGSHFYFVVRASYGLPVVPVDQEWYGYRLEGVAPGDYFVLATRRDVTPFKWQAGYTQFVRCGNTVACKGTPHTLLPVHVSAGSTVSGIDPADSVDSSVVPNAGLPPLDLASQPTTFPDLTQASASIGHDQGADMQLLNSTSDCPVNVACAVLTGQYTGHASAYFTYELGTNGLFRTCASYFLNDAAGWHLLEWHCPRLTTAFPAVGSSGQLAFPPFSFETGCINIHSAPGLTAKVVSCLQAGTNVTIDDGPYYLPETTSPADPTKNLWWHVASQGWVVHRYVEASP